MMAREPKLIDYGNQAQSALKMQTCGHFDESMQDDVENWNEAKTDIAIIDGHIWMLGTQSRRQLKSLVEKALGIFLMETQMLVVPVVL